MEQPFLSELFLIRWHLLAGFPKCHPEGKYRFASVRIQNILLALFRFAQVSNFWQDSANKSLNGWHPACRVHCVSPDGQVPASQGKPKYILLRVFSALRCPNFDNTLQVRVWNHSTKLCIYAEKANTNWFYHWKNIFTHGIRITGITEPTPFRIVVGAAK